MALRSCLCSCRVCTKQAFAKYESFFHATRCDIRRIEWKLEGKAQNMHSKSEFKMNIILMTIKTSQWKLKLANCRNFIHTNIWCFFVCWFVGHVHRVHWNWYSHANSHAYTISANIADHSVRTFPLLRRFSTSHCGVPSMKKKKKKKKN